MSILGTVRRRAFGVPSPKSVFDGPGFAPAAWQLFSGVAVSLVDGYNAALEDPEPMALIPRLEAVDGPLQGFAYEGAGMALGALDIMAPWKLRLEAFVTGPAAGHIYPIYVGVGLALARLKRNPERYLRRLDPLLGPVVIDGYGFHEGFFNWHKAVVEKKPPRSFSPWARRVYDQGLGRAIWFSGGADLDRTMTIIGAFPATRHPDLWAGVGLASAYGGGSDRPGLERLLTVADEHRLQLARGAATAAWGRSMAGNPAAHTDLSCEVVCAMPADAAVEVIRTAGRDLPAPGAEHVYEVWRQRTEAGFAAARS